MSCRATIFGKLQSAQKVNIFHPLDGARSHVCGKFRIAKDGKAFFQTELKPISAGDPITRPIVKIFVGHYRFYSLKSCIGGRFRFC